MGNPTSEMLAVLAASEIDADASIETLAERTGFRTHKVRYALHRLRQLGVLNGRYPLLDTYRLGFNNIAILFSLSAGSTKDRLAAVEEVIKFSSVAWFSELVGRYEFGALLVHEQIDVVNELCQKLRKGRKVTIAKRSITVRVGFWVFPRRYLATKVRHPVPVALQAVKLSKVANTTDEVNRRILRSLSENQWSEFKTAARKENLPLPTFYRRVSDLRKSLILRRFLWGIDLQLLRIQRYRLLLNFIDAQPATLQRLLQFAGDEKNVTNIAECIGSWDYEVSIEVYNSDELTSFVNRLHDAFGGQLVEVQSLAVNRYRKFQMMPGE